MSSEGVKIIVPVSCLGTRVEVARVGNIRNTCFPVNDATVVLGKWNAVFSFSFK